MPRSTGECESGEFIVDLVSLGKAFPNNTVSPLRYLTLTPSLRLLFPTQIVGSIGGFGDDTSGKSQCEITA